MSFSSKKKKEKIMALREEEELAAITITFSNILVLLSKSYDTFGSM